MNKNVKTILAAMTLGLFCFAQAGFAVTKTATLTGVPSQAKQPTKQPLPPPIKQPRASPSPAPRPPVVMPATKK